MFLKIHKKDILITNNKKEYLHLIKYLIWMLNSKKYLIRWLKMLWIPLFKDIMELFLLTVKQVQEKRLL